MKLYCIYSNISYAFVAYSINSNIKYVENTSSVLPLLAKGYRDPQLRSIANKPCKCIYILWCVDVDFITLSHIIKLPWSQEHSGWYCDHEYVQQAQHYMYRNRTPNSNIKCKGKCWTSAIAKCLMNPIVSDFNYMEELELVKLCFAVPKRCLIGATCLSSIAMSI